MGKNTAINRKKKQAKLRKRQRAKLDVDSLSIQQLLINAQEQIDSFQYESAQRLCQEALKREPDNVLALETSASLCLEVGNFEGAKHCLGRAITVQPEEGHEKYMSMAQLLSGKDALQCYQKGIDILTRVVNSLPERTKDTEEIIQDTSPNTSNTAEGMVAVDQGSSNDKRKAASTVRAEGCENEPEMGAGVSESKPQVEYLQMDSGDSKASLVKQISTAYCSMAELFMTDLCDDDDAEQQCQATITQAINADLTNPEAYQHMASFLLVKQDTEEAKTYINKSLEIWLPKYKEVDEGKAVVGSFDPVKVCPLSYPARLSTARILIEVEDYKHATDVLEGLAEEDDEVVDTWYLLGWTYYLQGEEYRDAAKYHLHRATQVHASSPSDDSQLVEHLQELTKELGPYTEVETGATQDGGIEEELERDLEEEAEDVEENMDTD